MGYRDKSIMAMTGIGLILLVVWICIALAAIYR